MKPPVKLSRIVDRKKYAVSTATLLCGDDYWDGHNFERHGRNCFLYRTPNNNYFFVNMSQWQGEDYQVIEPCTRDEAIEFYDSCRDDDQRVTFADAFPGVEVLDA